MADTRNEADERAEIQELSKREMEEVTGGKDILAGFHQLPPADGLRDVPLRSFVDLTF